MRQEALEAAEPEQGDTVCRIEPEPRRVSMSWDVGVGTRNMTTLRGATIDLRVSNTTDSDGNVTVVATAVSEAGRTQSVIASEPLPARVDELFPLDPSCLGLPESELEFSGSLTLSATLTLDDGTEQTTSLPLFFHPVELGWQVYDEESRDRDWNVGALSLRAQEELARARERLEPGARITSIGRARRAQEGDITPAPDGPADGEEVLP